MVLCSIDPSMKCQMTIFAFAITIDLNDCNNHRDLKKARETSMDTEHAVNEPK